MAKAKVFKEPDPKKLTALEKLHEKNAALKDRQMKLRAEILEKNADMRKVVEERHALADEITRLRDEVMAVEPGSRNAVDPAAVTAACSTPGPGAKKTKKE